MIKCVLTWAPQIALHFTAIFVSTVIVSHERRWGY